MPIIKQLRRAIPIALAVLLLAGVTSAEPARSSSDLSILHDKRLEVETKPASYRIVDLGSFGSAGSETYSTAYGLNERGDVVGSAEDDEFASRPFLYRKGVLIDIGSLEPEYRSGTAKSINAGGQIVGRSIGWSPYPKFPTWVQRPFRSTARGGLVDATPGTGIDGEAFDINNRGQMAVTLTRVPEDRAITRAHLWDPQTGLHEISFPSQPEGVEAGSAAWAINQGGQVAGAFEDEQLNPHAYVWNPQSNNVVDLHHPSALASGAYAINERGDAAGWLVDAQGTFHAVVWARDGRIVEIPALQRPELRSGTAEDLNNRGDVVGWFGTVQGLDPLAWVAFDAADDELSSGDPEAIALVDLLGETDRGEWELWFARGINNARQIVGIGLHNGLIRGFLMTPSKDRHRTLKTGHRGTVENRPLGSR